MGWHQNGFRVGWPVGDHRRWWLLGVLLFGIGDLVTTAIGLATDGITEANPVVASLIGDGDLLAMGMLKVFTLALCFLLWRAIPRPHSLGIPLALALVGAFATAWNLHILLRVTHDIGMVSRIVLGGYPLMPG